MRKTCLAVILSILLTSACAQQKPTPTATFTSSPTVTRRPLPPTWTVGPTTTPVTETPTPPNTALPALGATALTNLPPTWTPLPFETVTPFPFFIPTIDPTDLALTPTLPPTLPGTGTALPTITPTSDLKQPPLSPASDVVFPAACQSFTQDAAKTSRIIGVGTVAKLFWNKTTQADSYRVWILHPDQHFVFIDATGEAEIDIPNETFNIEGIYGWELVAYKGIEPVCQHLSGVFIVRRLS